MDQETGEGGDGVLLLLSYSGARQCDAGRGRGMRLSFFLSFRALLQFQMTFDATLGWA